jgi:hypothetical protein
MIGVVLLLGVVFGMIAREDRRVRTQAALIGELAQMGVYGDGRPTLLCFIAMKLHSTDSRSIEAKYAGWLDRGWFYRADHFNAGTRLKEEQVPVVVRLIGRFGPVKEVHYNEPPSLKGLRLFYVGEIPYHRLGVPKESCTFRDHTPDGATPSRE